MADPLNLKKTLDKRMGAEGANIPAAPASAPANAQFFKPFSPEEKAKQNAKLARILAERDMRP